MSREDERKLVAGFYIIICFIIGGLGYPIALVAILGLTLWRLFTLLLKAEDAISEHERKLMENRIPHNNYHLKNGLW